MGVEAIPGWCAPYIGLPYLSGGRTRAGVDCWGLLNLVWAERFGLMLPSYDGPLWQKGASAKDVAAAASAFSANFKQIEPGQEREGDGLLLRMLGVPLHVALVVAPGWMLHVEDNNDSCLETYRSFQWEKRILGFYRHE